MQCEKADPKIRETMAGILSNAEMRKHPSFESWALTLLRSGSIYERLSRSFTHLRRFRLAAMLFRIASRITVGIETGALLLVSTAALLLLLPPLLFFSLGILLTSLWEAPRKKRELLACSAEKRIYVLFLPPDVTPFFQWNVRDLAHEKDHIVLLISPFYVSSRGLKKGAFYCTLRRECKDVFLMRRYAFFYFKKRVLGRRECVYWY